MGDRGGTSTLCGIGCAVAIAASSIAAPSTSHKRSEGVADNRSHAQGGQMVKSFHIGNSLTWDSMPWGLPALADQSGFLADSGWHIRCGWTLIKIWNSPEDTCLDPTPYGYFQDALQNHQLDMVTMQPFGYGGQNSWLSDDLDVIAGCIDLAHSNPDNEETEFFVLMAWPQLNLGDVYDNRWEDPLDNPENPSTNMTKAYFDTLAERLLEDQRFASESVYVIPTGYVLAEISQMAQSGDFDEFTGVEQLYRDTLHLSYSVGQFTAALTHYASIYGRGPVGLVRPDDWLAETDIEVTDDLAQQLASVVWQVVRSHPHTKPAICPADISGDDEVGLDDFTIFLVAFGSSGTTAADINRDGVVDIDDFTDLLISWGNSCN